MTEQEFLTSTDPQAMLKHLQGTPKSATPGRFRPCKISDRKRSLFVEACHDLCTCIDGPVRGKSADECARIGDQPGCPCTRAARAALIRDICGNPYHRVTVWEECGILKTERACAGGNPFTHFSSCPDCHGDCKVAPDWLTPQVKAIAKACYEERVTSVCKWCGGKGTYGEWSHTVTCEACHGTGTLDTGHLDPDRLGVLADALEDAECDNEDIFFHLRGIVGCHRCEGAGYIYETQALSSWRHCPACNGEGLIPAPPHVRGCWAIDLLLGKE